MLPLIEAGQLQLPDRRVYDLGQVGDALRESEHGHPAGKLVVVALGAGQPPRSVERDPPAPVRAARVDHRGAAPLPEAGAVAIGAAERQRADPERDVARLDRARQLDLDLGSVVDECPQRGARSPRDPRTASPSAARIAASSAHIAIAASTSRRASAAANEAESSAGEPGGGGSVASAAIARQRIARAWLAARSSPPRGSPAGG